MRALILRTLLPALLLAWMTPAQAQQRPVVEGLAIVNDDASLSINGTLVRLYGITIPKLGILCLEGLRGSRRTCSNFNVADQLDDRIRGFVHCEIVGRDLDGVVRGICSIEGRDRFSPRQDIGAWLVNEGLAVVQRDGPPEYDAYQQIAKARGAGIWSGALVPELNDQGTRPRFY